MDPTAVAGIVVSVVATLALSLIDPKKAAPHWRLALWCTVIGGGLYAISVIVLQGVGAMRVPFWSSVMVGAAIGAVAVGLAWKQVQPIPKAAEAQSTPSKPGAPPVPSSSPPANVGSNPGGKALPIINQHSEGPNSPNIAGDHNSVVINPKINPSIPVTTWDFNGAKRVTAPGRSELTVGEETGIFEKMQQLYSANDWVALAQLCESQIAKTPDWYTPHLYGGVAHARLGQGQRAVELFQYVVDKVGGHPQYADAEKNLRILRGQ